MLNIEQVQAFDRDGFVIVDNLFSAEEVAILLDAVEHSLERQRQVSNMPDAAGRSSKLSLWMDAPDDVFGALKEPADLGDLRRI